MADPGPETGRRVASRLTHSILLIIGWLAAVGAASAQPTCPYPPRAPAAPAGPAESALLRGNTELERGNARAALAAYQESERLARESGEKRLTWLAAANAQRAAVEAGELAGVEAKLDALTAEAAAPPGLRPTLMIHAARTWLRIAERDPGRGARAGERASELLAQAAEIAAADGDLRVRSYALGYRGALYERAGRRDEARALTRSALFEAGRANAPDALYRWHFQLGRLELADGDRARALGSFRESVRILDMLRAELSLGSASDAVAFRDEVEPVYLALVDLLLRSAAEAGTREPEKRQAALRETRDTLEAFKAAELRDYFGDPCLAAQRQTAAEAIPGAVVLYPVVLADRVELIVGSESGLSAYPVPVKGPALTDAVRRFRELLPKRTTREYLPVAEQLYDWLIRPAAPALDGQTISALVVVPGGALRTIPFGALRDRRSGQFLAEKVALATAPGLTLTEPRRIDRARVELLAAGISESVQGYPPLPSVRAEIAGIESRFRGVALVDGAFRADRFAQEVGTRPFGIVHIASHGEFRGQASDSYVLAYDRRVSMSELAGVVGRTRLRNEAPLELLALSACQTAAGDDRAALGLAGVALRAGARSALATLWSVSDDAAAVLVDRFYSELAGGTSRAEALRRAQLALLATRAYRHPGYWAPFLLISSWL
jgi:CHAT domain-containing protein